MIVKPQFVRLLDVFLFGPVMIAIAIRKGRMSKMQRASLLLIGVGTVFYNLGNWYMIEGRAGKGENE